MYLFPLHSGAGYSINDFFLGSALTGNFSTKIAYSDPKGIFSFDFGIRGHPRGQIEAKK